MKKLYPCLVLPIYIGKNGYRELFKYKNMNLFNYGYI